MDATTELRVILVWSAIRDAREAIAARQFKLAAGFGLALVRTARTPEFPSYVRDVAAAGAREIERRVHAHLPRPGAAA